MYITSATASTGFATSSAGGGAAPSRMATQAGGHGDADEVRKLRERDREVRAHEAAHVAAGGDLVRGGMNLRYERGPDGATYAVGGEVQIDTSPVVGDPGATLEKAARIRRAALAPADPSAKDRQVAAEAAQMAAQARAEIAKARRDGAGAYGLAADPVRSPALDLYA